MFFTNIILVPLFSLNFNEGLSMKIGIVGAGAMGSLFAYFMQKAGTDAIIVEKDAAVVNAMKKGFRVSLSGSWHGVSAAIGSDPELLDSCDFVFLFVKSHATLDAVSQIGPHIGGSTVISLQNGLGNVDILLKSIPADQVVYGTTTYGAAKTGPDEIVFGGEGITVIGGRDGNRVKSVADLLGMTGMRVQVTDDPDKALWEKAIVNAGINPIGALLAISNGRIIEHPELRLLLERIVQESSAVAEAAGISVDADAMVKSAEEVCRKTSRNLCSMLQDLRAGRRTEIDSITGEIIQAGAMYGISTPYNETLFMLVKGLEPGQSPVENN